MTSFVRANQLRRGHIKHGWSAQQKGWSSNLYYSVKGACSVKEAVAEDVQCLIVLIWNVQPRQIHRHRKSVSSHGVGGALLGAGMPPDGDKII